MGPEGDQVRLGSLVDGDLWLHLEESAGIGWGWPAVCDLNAVLHHASCG